MILVQNELFYTGYFSKPQKGRGRPGGGKTWGPGGLGGDLVGIGRRKVIDLSRDLSSSIATSSVQVLLNASAIGIYGDRGEESLPESASAGEGYLAELCRDWEDAVEVPEGVRTVFLRTGVVLGKGGRAWS